MSKQHNSTEKTAIDSDDPRIEVLSQWLQNRSYRNYTLEPASQDASFRRYFRMRRAHAKSLIIMDAPPEKESLSPFIEIATDWKNSDIAVPELYEYSREHGFLIMQDFGSQTLLNVMNKENILSLYKAAIDELINIQTHSMQHILPGYDEHLLMKEMQLFIDWFLIKHCNYSLPKAEENELLDIFSTLMKSALSQKTVNVHRDYHSRNLMYRERQLPGVLDFQDAVRGPISYDLVSLLKDCYIKLLPKQRDYLLAYYLNLAGSHNLIPDKLHAEFRESFDLMGLQRHLKAIGIFSRLYYRDGKSDYLKDIPRTAGYILDLADDLPQFECLFALLDKVQAATPNQGG